MSLESEGITFWRYFPSQSEGIYPLQVLSILFCGQWPYMKYTMFYPLGFEGISCNSVLTISVSTSGFQHYLWYLLANVEAISKNLEKIDPGIKFANLQQNEVGPPILGQLVDLISLAKINISEPRFKWHNKETLDDNTISFVTRQRIRLNFYGFF